MCVLNEALDVDYRKILVAGSYICRRGIASIVRDVVPSASIVEVSCFSDARERLALDEFFAAFFDIDLGEPSGPVIFRMLRADHPQLIVRVVSRCASAGAILGYLAMGVNGYMLEWSSETEIEYAIRAILRRAIYIPPDVKESAAPEPDRQPEPPRTRRNRGELTRRQSIVLGLLLKGYSNKAIAKELDLSPCTIKIHVSALLRHFSVQRRADLAIATSSRGDELLSSRLFGMPAFRGAAC
jgi:two-component system, NarL family, nitrate/nitrite response regulator NarL